MVDTVYYWMPSKKGYKESDISGWVDQLLYSLRQAKGKELFEKVKILFSHQQTETLQHISFEQEGGNDGHKHIFKFSEYGLKGSCFDEVAAGYAVFTDMYACSCGRKAKITRHTQY